MKKLVSMLFILCLLIAGTSAIFAASGMNTVRISLTDAQMDKTKEYQAANMMMNGRHVFADVPPVLFVQGGKTRTLVPIRFITDTLGAEVTWDNKTKEATLILEDKVIVLKADSTTAMVDGIPSTLPDNVAVKLLGVGYNYRTMVPVRFVAEQLGLDVGWIQESQTVTIAKPLTAVKSVVFNGSRTHPELVFKTTGEVAFTTHFVSSEDSDGPDQLVLDLADTLFDLEEKSSIDMNGTSHLTVSETDILSVEGSQVEVVPYRTRFVVNMDREIAYETTYDPEAKEIRLAFKGRIKEPDPKPEEPAIETPVPGTAGNNRVIVLDAGHGAHDPGATSPFSGTKEKDLALTIAKKLEQRLEAQGFTVYMTREDDTFIGLYDRAAIANRLEAGVFLSIHINASTKQEPNGVEMLYVPDWRDSKNLAQVLQTEVVKATDAVSIGLIQRPNLVVIRETWMPAVLAELGFLTNATEEQRLLDDSYQNRLVEGMVNALTKYID